MYIPRILFLEDNAAEARLITTAAQSKGYSIKLENIDNWQELTSYCQKIQSQKEHICPDLILVGQQLSGYYTPEIIRYLRSIPALDTVPIIVYSHFSEPNIIADCYRAGANSYILKPAGFNDSSYIIQDTIEYWFLTNVFPNKHTFNRALLRAV